METVKIKIFKSIDYKDLSFRVFEEHNKRLEELNISIKSSDSTWISNPNTYCIAAIEECNNRILGATRIQVYDNVHPLPIEEALRPFNIGFNEYIFNWSKNSKIAEGCGLWCIKDEIVTGIKLSLRLYCLSLPVSRIVNINNLIGLCPTHTIKTVIKAGFKYNNTYPEPFHYPSDKYKSYIVEADTFIPDHSEGDHKYYYNKIIEDPNYSEYIEIGQKEVCLQHEFLINNNC